jgi:hypothetical protein
MPQLTRNKTKILLGVFAFLILALLALSLAVIFANQNQSDDSKFIEAQVRKLILVDPQESPTIAKILDINKISYQNPTLYANVRNGDYLVIFTDKAIVYRPSTNILINVLPVTATPQSPEQSTAN